MGTDQNSSMPSMQERLDELLNDLQSNPVLSPELRAKLPHVGTNGNGHGATAMETVQAVPSIGSGSNGHGEVLPITGTVQGDQQDQHGPEDAAGTAQGKTAAGFFERNTEIRPEIVEGLFREGEIVTFSGPFNVGKSPWITHFTISLLNGLRLCGRQAARRPVVHFDFETPGPVYRRNLLNIARRFNVPVPQVPEELDPFLEKDDPHEPNTARLLEALKSSHFNVRFALVEEAMRTKPDAVVIIDPVEMLFRVDTNNKLQVLALYNQFRLLLSRYPKAAMLISFNLRKQDAKGQRASLLTDPRKWLEEVYGHLDLANRSDVRLGMDLLDDETRTINGIRRGEDMHPILVRSFGEPPDNLAGFEQVASGEIELLAVLTSKQMDYWRALPSEFRFNDVADKVVPRASLSRLLTRARSLGLVQEVNGVYKKVPYAS